MGAVTTLLESRIASGELTRDDAQILACEKLDELLENLEGYEGKGGLVSRLLKRNPTPIGLYLSLIHI